MSRRLVLLDCYSNESIAEELRRIAALTGRPTVTRKDLKEFGRVDGATLLRRFGTLRHANEAAGLRPNRYTKATREELQKIMVDLWAITAKEYGRPPRERELKERGFPVSSSTIDAHFGSWTKALMATAALMVPAHPLAQESTDDDAVATEAAARPSTLRPRRQRGVISVYKRFTVFRRDQFTCCKCHCGGGELHVDHIVPVCHGGSDRLDNLQTLCRSCNLKKSGRMEHVGRRESGRKPVASSESLLNRWKSGCLANLRRLLPR